MCYEIIVEKSIQYNGEIDNKLSRSIMIISSF